MDESAGIEAEYHHKNNRVSLFNYFLLSIFVFNYLFNHFNCRKMFIIWELSHELLVWHKTIYDFMFQTKQKNNNLSATLFCDDVKYSTNESNLILLFVLPFKFFLLNQNIASNTMGSKKTTLFFIQNK